MPVVAVGLVCSGCTQQRINAPTSANDLQERVGVRLGERVGRRLGGPGVAEPRISGGMPAKPRTPPEDAEPAPR